MFNAGLRACMCVNKRVYKCVLSLYWFPLGRAEFLTPFPAVVDREAFRLKAPQNQTVPGGASCHYNPSICNCFDCPFFMAMCVFGICRAPIFFFFFMVPKVRISLQWVAPDMRRTSQWFPLSRDILFVDSILKRPQSCARGELKDKGQ